MDDTRRRFFKLAGGALVLAAGGSIVGKAVAQDTEIPVATPAPTPAPTPTPEPPPIKKGESLKGKKWGMVIDLTKGPKSWAACQDACHSIHNVPDFGNKKDEIKWIWDAPFEGSFPLLAHEYTPHKLEENPALVLCNHCENPPCVRACPTQATFKREDGIVLMDFHRCIGCRFCVSACPYGARSLNFRDPGEFIKKVNEKFPTRMRGVVEKCNFCAERLAQGQVPACVKAAKNDALIFGDLNDPKSKIRRVLRERFTITRKNSLGTKPKVFYIV
jgi:[DsrC]-trisulfide reductase subunit O